MLPCLVSVLEWVTFGGDPLRFCLGKGEEGEERNACVQAPLGLPWAFKSSKTSIAFRVVVCWHLAWVLVPPPSSLMEGRSSHPGGGNAFRKELIRSLAVPGDLPEPSARAAIAGSYHVLSAFLSEKKNVPC